MGSMSSGKVQADINPTSTLTGEQHALSNALIGTASGNLFGTTGTNGTLANPNVYPGQRVAYPSALQVQANNWGFDLPQQTQQYMNMATGATNRAMAPLNFQPTYDYTARLWERDIMPSIMNRASGMDAAGNGGTIQSLIRGGQDLSLGMGAQLADRELAGRELQLQGANQYGQIAQMPLAGLSTLGTLGGQQRDVTQQILTGQQQAWTEAQPWSNPMLAYALQLLPQSGQQMENVVSQEPRSLWDWTKGVFRF
jgi:hypothetical protein